MRVLCGQVAQLVEQRTENPCVGSSILPLATSIKKAPWVQACGAFAFSARPRPTGLLCGLCGNWGNQLTQQATGNRGVLCLLLSINIKFLSLQLVSMHAVGNHTDHRVTGFVQGATIDKAKNRYSFSRETLNKYQTS
jgi:hypothetical protein